MEPKTKKYLIGGGVVVAGLLVYLRLKHDDKLAEKHDDKKAKKPPSLTPAQIAAQMPNLPSTASQFSPVGFVPIPQYPTQPLGPYAQYPSTYNQYPISQYPTPQYPVGYPGQYPVSGYATGGTTPPNINGMTTAQAISVLQSLRIPYQIVSLNGIPRAVSSVAYPNGQQQAFLTVVAGRVTNVSYSGQSNSIYPAAY